MSCPIKQISSVRSSVKHMVLLRITVFAIIRWHNSLVLTDELSLQMKDGTHTTSLTCTSLSGPFPPFLPPGRRFLSLSLSVFLMAVMSCTVAIHCSSSPAELTFEIRKALTVISPEVYPAATPALHLNRSQSLLACCETPPALLSHTRIKRTQSGSLPKSESLLYRTRYER